MVVITSCGKKLAPRPPPEEKSPPEVKESVLDYAFFEKTCA
jgi:hypothetical protein